MFLPSYSDMNAQGLDIGFDEEGGKLINHVSPGFEFYGTPGYNLWYKFTVTNDQGASSSGMNMGGGPDPDFDSYIQYSLQHISLRGLSIDGQTTGRYVRNRARICILIF